MMHMTDQEILRSYAQAENKKDQVQILAELNACGTWEMFEKLTELGAQVDARWYQHLNPKREGMSSAGGKKTKKITENKEERLSDLRRQLREANETITALRKLIEEVEAAAGREAERLKSMLEAQQASSAEIIEGQNKEIAWLTDKLERTEEEANQLIDAQDSEIKRLHEAKRAGLSVGDTVFRIDALRCYESTVRRIIYDTEGVAFDERAIGASVFLSRDAAEKALREDVIA